MGRRVRMVLQRLYAGSPRQTDLLPALVMLAYLHMAKRASQN